MTGFVGGQKVQTRIRMDDRHSASGGGVVAIAAAARSTTTPSKHRSPCHPP